MTLPNHVVGGLTFTGIFASFLDVNILAHPSYIGLTIFAAILPDIDHTKSVIGKLFYPLAKWINRHYGHRTITHTLLFLIIGTLVVGIIQNNFTTDNSYTKIFAIAFTSHLVLDMMTVQGVPLFFPFLRNPCVLPANPEKRFRTGNLRTETMWFSIFLVLGVFCYPLMKNGFWMQYNRSFGTLTHLTKQFKLSENVLKVKYQYREGSDHIKGEGYCIEASENEVIILDFKTNNFKALTSNLTAIKVYPTETQKQLQFSTESFTRSTLEEVKQVMQQAKFKHIDLSANTPFVVSVNGIHSEVSNYSEKYPNNIRLIPIEPDEIEPFKENPKIKLLASRIEILETKDNRKLELYNIRLEKLRHLESKLETVDLGEKELLIKEIREMRKITKKPSNSSEIIKEIEIELSALRQEQVIEKQFHEEQNQQEELRFNGSVTKITIK